MPGINVTKVGDWGRARRTLNGLVSTVPAAATLIHSEASLAARRTQENIRRQAYNDWPPLAKSTEQKKKTNLMLVETGQYVDAIRVVRSGFLWTVGIPHGTKNDRGVPLAMLGVIHEYGWGPIPPRPHWRRESATLKRSLSVKLGALLRAKVSLRA